MYIYMLPLDATAVQHNTPKHDGGLEHTAAEFDDARSWAEKTRHGNIIVISPQSFLISMLAQFFAGRQGNGDYAAERSALLNFVRSVPTGPSGHSTCQIPWADKVMSPTPSGLFHEDGRAIIKLDWAGPELGVAGSTRGGDYDRVVVSRRERTGPPEAEIMWRKDVWPQAEARARIQKEQAKEGQAAKL